MNKSGSHFDGPRETVKVPEIFYLRPNHVLNECQLWVGQGEPRCHLRDVILKGEAGHR